MNQRDAIHYIATRQKFEASALSGVFKNYTPETGRLNQAEGNQLAETFATHGGAYIVYSYGTPIAWHSIEGWYVVEQKFSQTTSKHQNLTRRAIAESLVSN